MANDSADHEEQVVDDVPCVACGCLCDDIALTVRSGVIVAAERACAKGKAWFQDGQEPADWPEATVDGQSATSEDAVSRAAVILREARSPVVIGLSHSSCEVQTAAVALADRIGAVVVLSHEDEARGRLAAFQRVGRVSASLGEVKSRADVVVFWGVDPITTHPRHFERYSVEPAGRFVSHGRTVLVADERETETMKRGDARMVLDPSRSVETLQTLRAIVRGIEVDGSGVDLAMARHWGEVLMKAHYGALFFGTHFGEQLNTAAELTELLMLIRELNGHTRFVALPMGGAGNSAGAENVLAWQTGYPSSVSLSRGYPSFEPERGKLRERLASGEFDAVVVVGEIGPIDGLTPIPTIAIGPNATRPGGPWTVGLAAAIPGIGGGGTVMRSDGVMLPLRPAIPSRWPDERRLLARLEEALR